MLARPPALCFFREFLCFCFSRSLKAIKRHRAWFLLSFAVVNIIKTIFVIMKLRFHKGRRSPAIIWLCFWFSSICFDKISQNFKIWENCFPIINKPKKRGCRGSFLAILQKIFLSDEAMVLEISETYCKRNCDRN